MTREPNTERLILLVPPKLRTQLEKAAQKESVSMAQIIRTSLRRYLEQPCAPASK